MPIEITMPALSPTMEEGQIASWLIKEGDIVHAGDVIAEIETDKAMVELEADMDGRIGKILIEAGPEPIPVHRPIALLLRMDEDESSLDHKPSPSHIPQTAAPEKKAPMPTSSHKMKMMTMREALRDAMAEEMRRDKNVFVIGEDVAQYQGAYKVTQGLLEEFGAERVIDTPITEHAIAGLAVGAAFAGLKPVVEFMTFNFAMQAMDQIINSAAKSHYMSGGAINCPIVFRGPNGAARQVAAQHAQDFSAWYAHIPGLLVVAPSAAADAKGLLKSAIRDPNPVLFLEHELLYGIKNPVPEEEDFLAPLGRAHVLCQGDDITIAAYSHAVHIALEAKNELAKENIACEVIDLRSLRPLDDETIIDSVKKTSRLVIVEGGWPHCGIGAEIAATIQQRAFDYLDAPIMRVSAADAPMPYAANLERLALPDAMRVMEAVHAACR